MEKKSGAEILGLTDRGLSEKILTIVEALYNAIEDLKPLLPPDVGVMWSMIWTDIVQCSFSGRVLSFAIDDDDGCIGVGINGPLVYHGATPSLTEFKAFILENVSDDALNTAMGIHGVVQEAIIRNTSYMGLNHSNRTET